MSESLCGFRKVIETLDNRQLVVTSHAGDVVKHGMCCVGVCVCVCVCVWGCHVHIHVNMCFVVQVT